MLTCRGTTTDDLPVIIIGLSAGNIARLQKEQPIYFDLANIGLAGRLFIFAGETEDSMAAELREKIGPDTQILDTRPPLGSLKR